MGELTSDAAMLEANKIFKHSFTFHVIFISVFWHQRPAENESENENSSVGMIPLCDQLLPSSDVHG